MAEPRYYEKPPKVIENKDQGAVLEALGRAAPDHHTIHDVYSFKLDARGARPFIECVVRVFYISNETDSKAEALGYGWEAIGGPRRRGNRPGPFDTRLQEWFHRNHGRDYSFTLQWVAPVKTQILPEGLLSDEDILEVRDQITELLVRRYFGFRNMYYPLLQTPPPEGDEDLFFSGSLRFDRSGLPKFEFKKVIDIHDG
ncbi:MAG: hypothetical protein AAF826_05335 [Pseudomonadota bacterium]